MAPRDGLESRRRAGFRLLPQLPRLSGQSRFPAGLYQSRATRDIIEEPVDASLFDFFFEGHGVAAGRTFLTPNQVPWTLESLRGLR